MFSECDEAMFTPTKSTPMILDTPTDTVDKDVIIDDGPSMITKVEIGATDADSVVFVFDDGTTLSKVCMKVLIL